MKIFITLLSALLLTSLPVFAGELDTKLIELNNKKKEMISDSIDLTDSQSTVFWELYAEYEKELENIYKEEFELIQKYNSKYNENEISEQSASNMLAQNFRIQGRELQIKQIYLGKFQEVLPKHEVLRFYLIDNKVNALLGSDFTKITPVAGTDLK